LLNYLITINDIQFERIFLIILLEYVLKILELLD
jgi:hypothetical protein